MKFVKLAMVLGMLASLIYCGKCEKKDETPKKEAIPSSSDGGNESGSSAPSDGGSSVDLDAGKTSSLDGSFHVFDAAVISIDASVEDHDEDVESGPSELNRG